MTEYDFKDLQLVQEEDDGRHDILLSVGDRVIRMTVDQARLVGCRLIEVSAIERMLGQIEQAEKEESE